MRYTVTFKRSEGFRIISVYAHNIIEACNCAIDRCPAYRYHDIVSVSRELV